MLTFNETFLKIPITISGEKEGQSEREENAPKKKEKKILEKFNC